MRIEKLNNFFGIRRGDRAPVVPMFNENADGDSGFAVHHTRNEPGIVAHGVGNIFFSLELRVV